MAIEKVPAALLTGLALEFHAKSNEAPKPEPSQKKQSQSKVPPSASDRGAGIYDLDGFMLKNFPDADGPTPHAGGGHIWVPQDCFFRPGDGPTMFVIQHPNGAISAGCQHATCPGSKSTGNHWKELREHFEGSDFMRQFPGNPGLDAECATLPRTEYGLAQRFRKRFGERCRYVETWGGKWLVYNGRYWEQSDCAAEIHAQETINSIRREAWHLKEADGGDGEEKESKSEQGAPAMGDRVSAGEPDPEPAQASEQPPAA